MIHNTYRNFLKNTKLQLLVILLLTGLSYSNIFQNEFIWDDPGFIKQWETIRSFKNIPKLLQGDTPLDHASVYRPVRGIFYTISYHLWGQENPLGYHIQSLLIYFGIIILVYLITQMVIGSWLLVHRKKQSTNYQLPTTNQIPFITALLFALHPIHVEAISFITASFDTIGILFFFLAFYLYIKFQQQKRILFYLLSLLSSLLAFFTYEMTLVLPLGLMLYDFCFNFKLLKFPKYLLSHLI